ncbi:MAG: hypothetical protein LBT00_14385 [Spirochaetaceae bacterium]|nr:hypothetical protein [Spirochaetaceae bacterium]
MSLPERFRTALRKEGWAYNPQHPVSGFRPGMTFSLDCFASLAMTGPGGKGGVAGVSPAEGGSGGRLKPLRGIPRNGLSGP